MKPQIPISPSIGKFDPRPSSKERLLVCVPNELVGPLKLLAFVREETMGHALGRAIRWHLDELGAGNPLALALEHWSIADQTHLLVPESLQARVQPDGRVPSLTTVVERLADDRQVGVPVSPAERITVRIAAFGQLNSVARWGADVLREHLNRLLPEQELWTLSMQQQIEALLPDEPAAWEGARLILEADNKVRAVRAVPRATPRVAHREVGRELQIPSVGDLFDE